MLVYLETKYNYIIVKARSVKSAYNKILKEVGTDMGVYNARIATAKDLREFIAIGGLIREDQMTRQDVFDFIIKLQQAALEEGSEIKSVHVHYNIPRQPDSPTDGNIKLDIRIKKGV